MIHKLERGRMASRLERPPFWRTVRRPDDFGAILDVPPGCEARQDGLQSVPGMDKATKPTRTPTGNGSHPSGNSPASERAAGDADPDDAWPAMPACAVRPSWVSTGSSSWTHPLTGKAVPLRAARTTKRTSAGRCRSCKPSSPPSRSAPRMARSPFATTARHGRARRTCRPASAIGCATASVTG